MVSRRSDRLRRPGVLHQLPMQQQSAVCVRPHPHRDPATQTAPRHHRILLREDEVPHRRGQSAELRAPGDIQRKVGPLTFWINRFHRVTSTVWSYFITRLYSSELRWLISVRISVYNALLCPSLHSRCFPNDMCADMKLFCHYFLFLCQQ